jgi:DNA-binding response OmpR family regulator
VGNWVLVVEDDPDTNAALVDLLRGAGFAARGTATVAGALNMMVDEPPALVISDILLDDHNATELLDMSLKILGPSAPSFVFMTGLPVSYATGVPTSMLIFRKPLNLQELLDVVARHCQRMPESQPGAPGP